MADCQSAHRELLVRDRRRSKGCRERAEDDKGRNGYGILPVRDVKDRTAVRKGSVLCKTKDDREPLRLGKCQL